MNHLEMYELLDVFLVYRASATFSHANCASQLESTMENNIGLNWHPYGSNQIKHMYTPSKIALVMMWVDISATQICL